jgi:lipopolysaccharide transport system ATP-binding protein
MTSPSLYVKGVGKAFRRYPSPWSRAREWLFGGQTHELMWVLRDISFEIAQGSAVGILGVNGAGKSTLLKIITGTTTPTSGEVSVKGRVAALLELGLGFHGEFTGRQNARMSGQMLGLDLAEIDAALPAIESFAGIGDFMDQPVRTYSSGMQMRLAFSVATAVRPDILIIDEALSVGDAAFQRKCFQRIEAFQKMGTSLLFVSHDAEAVKRLCDHALFIHGGRIASEGSPRQVCDDYERQVFGGDKAVAGSEPEALEGAVTVSTHFDETLVSDCEQRYGNGEADIEACWLEDALGSRVNVAAAGDTLFWCYRVRFHENIEKPVYAMMLKTTEGTAVFGTDTSTLREEIESCTDNQPLLIRFQFTTHLAPGNYFLNAGLRRDSVEGSVFMSRRVDAAVLRIVAGDSSSAAVGPADLNAQWAALPLSS